MRLAAGIFALALVATACSKPYEFVLVTRGASGVSTVGGFRSLTDCEDAAKDVRERLAIPLTVCVAR